MISFIVPVYNEEESLTHFYQEVIREIPNITKVYEIIFVDDGSTDTSLDVLKKISQENKNVRIFSFRTNRGKSEVLTFGFQKAKGDYLVTLDADLQDNPSEMSKLVEKAKEGWEVVCGWRKNRQDSPQKIISSKLFNILVGIFWGLHLHDYNCGLKVYTRDAAKSLHLYG